MKLKMFIALSSVISGVFFSTCAPSEKKVEEANQKVDEAQKKLDDAEAEAKARAEEWQKYKTETESRTIENDKKIAELRAQMVKEKKEVQIKYEKRINELEEKNSGIRKKLIDFKEGTKENWDTLKVEVDRDIREFDHDLEGLGDALKNFGKKNK